MKPHALLVLLSVAVFTGPASLAGAGDKQPLQLPPIRALAFSPDGGLLAAATGEPKDTGAVILWDLGTRKPRLLHREPKGIPTLAFGPGGKLLATGTFTDQAKLLDVSNGKEIAVLPGHGKAARSVAFAPDGKTLAVGSYNKFIKLWDVKTRKTTKTLEGHNGRVYSVAFSPDGKQLVSSSTDNTAKIWSLADGRCLYTAHHESLVSRAFFTGDGQNMLSVGWDGKANVRDARTGVLRASFWGTNCAACSPDTRIWVSCGGGHTVRIFKIEIHPPGAEELKRIRSWLGQLDDDSYEVREAATRDLIKLGWPAEKELYTAMKETSSPEVRIRTRFIRAKLRSPDPDIILRGHRAEVEWVEFSPDGKLLASGDRVGRVRLWDTATWRGMELEYPSRGGVSRGGVK